MPQRGSGLAVSKEQLHAVRDTLSDELVDADSVCVDLSEPNLAKFVVSVGEQQRYRLAVTREFFTVCQTPHRNHIGIGDPIRSARVTRQPREMALVGSRRTARDV